MRIGLVVEGAFQAWGIPSEFETRAVAYKPTKRGIAGLIGCCMGIPREDERLESLMAQIDVTVDTNKDKNGEPRNGTMMMDYQTVKTDDNKFNTASGKTITKSGIILKKYYLNDASFTIHIESKNKELLQEIYDAIDDPVWVPYLGRKNCLPTVPLIPYWEE